MTESTAALAVKRNVNALQKAIVTGLENVKAQDIQVFDTEHITSLFERVIVASGTSNRQTKALAASVRDAVRQAGFDKPRTEGEDNGEWIIVDCGAAVAHIMQPLIRQYYHLEELWGEKPVRLKPATAPKARAGATKPQEAAATPARKAAPRKAPAKTSEKTSEKTAEKTAIKPSAKSSTQPSKKTVLAAPSAAVKTPAKRSSKAAPAAAKKAVGKAVGKAPVKAVARAAAKVAGKAAAPAAPAKKSAARKAPSKSSRSA
jgi:ribosome-associated protein